MRIDVMQDIEPMVNKTLDYLCKDYSGDAPHRVTMRAAFEIFAAQIVFCVNNERLLKIKNAKRNYLMKVQFRWLENYG